MNAKCFLITETDQIQRSLRRYSQGYPYECSRIPGQYSYHNASVPLDVVHESLHDELHGIHPWPTECACGYKFTDKDHRQVFTQHLYKNEAGAVMTIRDAPPGAMWFADWMIHDPKQTWYRGPDGHCLMIKGFYGDEFCPDGRASNCGLPNDDNHKCWVRVGTVPNITIGKQGGPTCNAGAGSFFFGGQRWHGFCKNGELIQG